MSFEVRSNLYPTTSHLTLARALNFLDDNRTRRAQECSMSTDMGAGPFPALRHWIVDTKATEVKTVIDPRCPRETVLVYDVVAG